MVRGAPWPDIYEWTWGEVIEYIACKDEARKEALRDQAMMAFRSASLTMRMIGAQKGTKFSVMEEFAFLWSDEERKAARVAELKAKLERRSSRKTRDTEDGEG